MRENEIEDSKYLNYTIIEVVRIFVNFPNYAQVVWERPENEWWNSGKIGLWSKSQWEERQGETLADFLEQSNDNTGSRSRENRKTFYKCVMTTLGETKKVERDRNVWRSIPSGYPVRDKA